MRTYGTPWALDENPCLVIMFRGDNMVYDIHVIMRCIVTCQRSITLLTAPVCGGCLVATINYMCVLLCCDILYVFARL
jgi:hypothetical protein